MRQLTLAILLAASAWSPAFAEPDENEARDQTEQAVQQPNLSRDQGGEFGVRGIDESRQARFEARAERQQQQQQQQAPTAIEVQVSDRGRGGGRGGFDGGFERSQQQQPPQAQPQQQQAPQAPAFDRGNRGGRGDSQPVVQQGNPRGWGGQDGGNWRGRGGGQADGNWRGRDGDDHHARDDGERNRGSGGGVVPVPPIADGRDGRWNGNRGESRGWGHNRDNSRDHIRGRDHHRWEGNRSVQNNGWQRGDSGHWARSDQGDHHYGNNRGNSGWDRGWRNDNRYNWQDYRSHYRDQYRNSRYNNPYGYNYGYRRFGVGVYLDSLFYSNRYWIDNPYSYRLPTAPYGYRWVRYYDDVLLVDVRNGYVVDVINDFFW